jgi:cytochrome c-type biogenesis protein CcmF
MTAIVLIGTIFPLISDTLSGQKVTVSANFYNKVVAPLGLLLVGLMSVGPLLSYGKDSAHKLARGLVLPGLFASAVVVTAISLGLRNVWALIAAAIAASAIANILVDIFRAGIHNHRRLGAQITHVGVMMIVVGVVGSSLFSQKETFAMKPGDSVPFGHRTLTLVAVDEVHQPIFQALQATVRISDGYIARELHPQMRQYANWEELNSQVSIRSTWKEDVYLTLAATDGEGGVTIQAIVNPLVSWLWIGGIVLSIGATIALLPRFTSAPVTKAEAKLSRHTGLVIKASA